MRATTTEAAGLLLAAILRSPFRLLRGAARVTRVAREDLCRHGSPGCCHARAEVHVWCVTCEPPCYGCHAHGCHHG